MLYEVITIRNAIQRELQAKGYSFSADRQSADFAVAYTVGTREMIRVDSYPADYRGPWGWHVPYSYYYYHDVSAHSYTQGTLGVDVFDNASRKPVWHVITSYSIHYTKLYDLGRRGDPHRYP